MYNYHNFAYNVNALIEIGNYRHNKIKREKVTWRSEHLTYGVGVGQIHNVISSHIVLLIKPLAKSSLELPRFLLLLVFLLNLLREISTYD